jgi:hypothetical protein
MWLKSMPRIVSVFFTLRPEWQVALKAVSIWTAYLPTWFTQGDVVE